MAVGANSVIQGWKGTFLGQPMIFLVFERHPRKSIFPAKIFASFLAGYICIPCTFLVSFFLSFFFFILYPSLLEAQGEL